ncbi:MAG: DUF1573 domain-containing protein [Bacteroidales bacterium]|nr:DUF1573 domain-containing protein [Bacteroidales bacterium]
MKSFFVALFAIGVLFSACSKTSDGEKIDVSVIDNMTTIKFERDVIDFKNVEEGEKVSGSFKFTNTGDHNLIIYEVNTSCGCTVADYPRGEIAPGESGMISVTYDSDGANGMRITKQVTVNANTKPAKTNLRIIADVH